MALSNYFWEQTSSSFGDLIENDMIWVSLSGVEDRATKLTSLIIRILQMCQWQLVEGYWETLRPRGGLQATIDAFCK